MSNPLSLHPCPYSTFYSLGALLTYAREFSFAKILSLPAPVTYRDFRKEKGSYVLSLCCRKGKRLGESLGSITNVSPTMVGVTLISMGPSGK
jgi:hypothetical protein